MKYMIIDDLSGKVMAKGFESYDKAWNYYTEMGNDYDDPNEVINLRIIKEVNDD